MSALVQPGPAAPLALIRPIAAPAELVAYHKEVAKLIVEALEEGVDFGVVPGTGDKPTLLKPGAERLCLAFGARPEYRLVESTVEHDRTVTYTKRKKRWFNGPEGRQWEWEEQSGESQGLYRYVYECVIVRGDGRIMGTGHGVCSTMESKYIDRPRDCENTALKMAQKRAFVAAVLSAFGLSSRFTQDLEEQQQEIEIAPAAEVPKEPMIYGGSPDEKKKLQGMLKKREVEAECWEPIHLALRGKAWTALTQIVPAERKRIQDAKADAVARAADPEAPAPEPRSELRAYDHADEKAREHLYDRVKFILNTDQLDARMTAMADRCGLAIANEGVLMSGLEGAIREWGRLTKWGTADLPAMPTTDEVSTLATPAPAPST